MNTYECFYKGRRITLLADTSLNAQRDAAKEFRAKKPWDVTVVLVAVGDRAVVHQPQDLFP